MTAADLIARFKMTDNRFYHSSDNLSWENVYSEVAPAMQSEGWESLDWYFIEDRLGAWKQPFGLAFWTRGGWVNRGERALVTYYMGTLMLRVFSTDDELDRELRTMRSRTA